MKASDQLKKTRDKVLKAIEDIEFDEFFEPMPDIIRSRTLDGYGITQDGGSKKNLKKLAKSTIIRREYLDRQGLLSDNTTPVTSNLTQSGQMLDSIHLEKVNSRKYRVELEDDRDDGESNNQIRKYNEQKGRTFFGLTKSDRRTLERNVQKKLAVLMRNLFK